MDLKKKRKVTQSLKALILRKTHMNKTFFISEKKIKKTKLIKKTFFSNGTNSTTSRNVQKQNK